jgi:hypothetical protein
MTNITKVRVTGQGKKATELMRMVRLIDIKGETTEMSISRKAADIMGGGDQTKLLQDTMIAVTVRPLGVLPMTKVPSLLTQVTTRQTFAIVKTAGI